jgi:hypothetical protein
MRLVKRSAREVSARLEATDLELTDLAVTDVATDEPQNAVNKARAA